MAKIKTIIIEDEQKGMDKLVAMLEDYCPNIEIIDKCQDGKKAIQSIEENRPQLIFLDIELGGINGFDVLSSVQHLHFETIMTTAHEEYGIQALKAGAIDYLLKPFSLAELKSAVQKVWTKIEESMQHSTGSFGKIRLPDTNGFILLPIEDIIYCEADNNCTSIYLKNKNKALYIVRTLGKIYEQLPKAQFSRISRSYVVNMKEIASYSRTDGGSIKLTNNKILLTRPGKFRDSFLEKFK